MSRRYALAGRSAVAILVVHLGLRSRSRSQCSEPRPALLRCGPSSCGCVRVRKACLKNRSKTRRKCWNRCRWNRSSLIDIRIVPCRWCCRYRLKASVASALLSTSTSLSASVASCFVSSEAFGLLATFPSSLSRMSLPASPFRVSSPFSTASFVWSTMPLSIRISSVTLSAGMGLSYASAVSVASASTVTVCASPDARIKTGLVKWKN